MPIVIDDFDVGPLSARWAAHGPLRATRVPRLFGSGSCLAITADGAGALTTRSIPVDWSRLGDLRLTLQVMKPGVMEVRLHETEGAGYAWRKVDLPVQGWTNHTLPLRWFRTDEAPALRWDRVGRLALMWRGPCELLLDDVAVGEGSPDLVPAELAPDLMVHHGEAATLLTDVADLNAADMLAHMARVREAVTTAVPPPPGSQTRPVLVILRTEDRYRQFGPALAQRYGARTDPPTTDGFTLGQIATGSGTILRPSHTHEYVHALLHLAYRLPGQGHWLQEGAATSWQLSFHPQADMGTIVRNGMSRTDHRTPLVELCAADKVPLNRYWQAMTLVRWLVHTGALGAVMSWAAAEDNVDLHRALGLDWPGIEADWAAWVRGTTSW